MNILPTMKVSSKRCQTLFPLPPAQSRDRPVVLPRDAIWLGDEEPRGVGWDWADLVGRYSLGVGIPCIVGSHI